MVLVAGYLLTESDSRALWVVLVVVSGGSLFVLTGLVHEGSHHLLAGRTWLNEVLGNLAGALLVTPLSAYRAFHLRHHQTTNHPDDPNRHLNSRWMLACGGIIYVVLVHLYAWRHLRGRHLVRYVVELTAEAALAIVIVCLLPRAIRERAVLAPLGVVVLLQNLRIVSEHLDLSSGKYHDTWQLVLPNWLSYYFLHFDHHLEHHLRPGLHWYELPGYRSELTMRQSHLHLHRVTLRQFAGRVFLAGCFPKAARRDCPQPAPLGETTSATDAA
jgi:fatty acid desaturase